MDWVGLRLVGVGGLITGGHSKQDHKLLVKIGKIYSLLCVPCVLYTMDPRNSEVSWTKSVVLSQAGQLQLVLAVTPLFQVLDVKIWIKPYNIVNVVILQSVPTRTKRAQRRETLPTTYNCSTSTTPMRIPTDADSDSGYRSRSRYRRR